MDWGKRPKFIHLVIALESVVLLAFLLLLTPMRSYLTVSHNGESGGQVNKEISVNETGTARNGSGDNEIGAGRNDSSGNKASIGQNGNSGGESGIGRNGDDNEAGISQNSSSGGIGTGQNNGTGDNSQTEQKDFIKWVDFGITFDALRKAFRYDINTCQAEIHLDWIEILSYLGTRYGGDFSRYKESDMEAIAERLQAGEKMADITADMEYYDYYHEAYTAVLGGMVGEYQIEIPAAQAPDFALPKDTGGNPIRTDGNVWVTKYGLKAFSPIAKNYPYTDYDDFGVSRSYGFRRVHLGHDLMGQVGTPVIAVESGYVEAIGWNQYGGWRLGIRSFDGKRYYYYAHLRRNYPYHKSLHEGSIVQAGDVIGYLGRTGYSRTENTNNIDEPHLHFGIQLIFDESQKDGNNEIWIDCYELIKFLSTNRAETVKDEETKEYYRVYQMQDPGIPGGAMEQKIPDKSVSNERADD